MSGMPAESVGVPGNNVVRGRIVRTWREGAKWFVELVTHGRKRLVLPAETLVLSNDESD